MIIAFAFSKLWMEVIIAGYTDSLGAGSIDAYLIKTDPNGDILWAKTFGSINADDAESVEQTSDGGYIITGYSRSFSANGDDVYLIKTDSLGNSGCNRAAAPFITITPPFQVSGTATIVASPTTIVTSPTFVAGSGGTVTTLCTSVGISQISNLSFPISISPNPFHNATTISLNETISFPDLTFEIFNVEGKMMRQLSITSHKTSINRNGLANGFYFYKLIDKEIIKSVGKLVIE